MTHDIFRPHKDPAKQIYDAFVAESDRRQGRPLQEWIQAERDAVLTAAVGIAQRMSLRTPTLEDVERAERSAQGHTDYGAKWAYRVAEVMTSITGDIPNV